MRPKRRTSQVRDLSIGRLAALVVPAGVDLHAVFEPDPTGCQVLQWTLDGTLVTASSKPQTAAMTLMIDLPSRTVTWTLRVLDRDTLAICVIEVDGERVPTVEYGHMCRMPPAPELGGAAILTEDPGGAPAARRAGPGWRPGSFDSGGSPRRRPRFRGARVICCAARRRRFAASRVKDLSSSSAQFGFTSRRVCVELVTMACVSLAVEGMMCQRNCGTTVQNALLGVSGVSRAEVSHADKCAARLGLGDRRGFYRRGRGRGLRRRPVPPTVTLAIEGMMCQRNCGTTVRNALLGVSGVSRAEVSHADKCARLGRGDRRGFDRRGRGRGLRRVGAADRHSRDRGHDVPAELWHDGAQRSARREQRFAGGGLARRTSARASGARRPPRL